MKALSEEIYGKSTQGICWKLKSKFSGLDHAADIISFV